MLKIQRRRDIITVRNGLPTGCPKTGEFPEFSAAGSMEIRQHPSFILIRALQGGISIGNTFNMELKDGAFCPGDYLYRSGSLKWDVESGMWGIFRVMKKGIRYKCKKTCRKVIERINNRL